MNGGCGVRVGWEQEASPLTVEEDVNCANAGGARGPDDADRLHRPPRSLAVRGDLLGAVPRLLIDRQQDSVARRRTPHANKPYPSEEDLHGKTSG